MKRCMICIPTYNEAENITELLIQLDKVDKLIEKYNLEPVIIDDNSPDGTAELVKKFQKENNTLKVHLINNPNKAGLGKAYIVGFKYCLENDADAVQMMDADFSHNPRYLAEILSRLEEYDLVLGSRYVAGGGTENWGLLRQLISKGGNIYSNLILGIGINDLTGGYNCFKREVLEKINLEEIKSNGYSFQIELKYKVKKQGFSHFEVPILFKDREHGTSKFDGSIFTEAIFTPWKLKFSN